MRQIFLVLLLLVSISIPHVSVAGTLQECLQRRLDAVLAGENPRKHLNLPGLLQLVLGKGNYNKIKDNPAAMKRFGDAAVHILKRRITEKSGEFVGAKLQLVDSDSPYSAQGTIMADGQPYNISIAFPARQECPINDIRVHGLFHLRAWLARQPEMQALMKEFKMKR